MFRYDRPQAGRYRQFTQWDVEVLGDPGPMVDAELIELGHRFYAEAGIADVVAYLNSIGDATCRPGYRQALIDYFGEHEDRLTDDSRRRLQVNPLRVLDDRQLDPELAAGAPRCVDHLCDACRDHFDAVLRLLDGAGRALRGRPPAIVRGLDYYTRTTFEFFVAGSPRAAAGAGRRRPLRRAGRAAGRTADAGDRLRAGHRSGRAGGAGAGRRGRAGSGRWWRWSSADPSVLEPRLRVARQLREAGLRVRRRWQRAQARPPARVRGQGRRALGGDRRRGAGAGRVVLRDLDPASSARWRWTRSRVVSEG